MQRPAQSGSFSPLQKPSKSGLSGSAKSRLGGLGKHVARQTWQEPFEIAKSAGRQVGGARPPQETQPGLGQAAPLRQGSAGQAKPPEPSPEEKKKHSRLEAFQRELEEMTRLQKKREEEMRARWQEPEEVKKQREEEARKAQKGLLPEPVARAKRGILGGVGRMVGLKRKQRQVEQAKTPTN